MKADFILNLIVFIISLDFIIDLVTGIFNYKNFEKKLPNNVNDIYNKDAISIYNPNINKISVNNLLDITRNYNK